MRDVALDAAWATLVCGVRRVAVAEDSIRRVSGTRATASQVAGVAGAAPRRHVGDVARCVDVGDRPVVHRGIGLDGGKCLSDTRAGCTGASRDWPQDPVVPVAVRVVARSAGQVDCRARVGSGAQRTVAPACKALFKNLILASNTLLHAVTIVVLN